MSKLAVIYPQAVEHTKMKIYQDIDRYLETKDTLPAFMDYLTDRGHYIEQIWIHVWLNKSTNDIPKHEKKQFLSEKGYEVHGVDRKLINKWFRDEMREYQPFDAYGWITEMFHNREAEWADRYREAKEQLRSRQEQALLQEKKLEIRGEIENTAAAMLEEKYDQFYLYIRYFAAKQLATDFKNKIKCQAQEGAFPPYQTVLQFFDSQKTKRSDFEYEAFYYIYEGFIFDHLSELVPKKVLENFDEDLKQEFYFLFHEQLTVSYIKGCIRDLLYDVSGYMFDDLQEEYLTDLLKLAEIPFDMKVHQQILEENLREREQRFAEELAKLQRKKEEEERMMKDIFGTEYDPSFRRQIRYVLHIGDTNTGKTYHALEKMKQAASGMYLAPLRLLALEVFDKLNAEGTPCSLKTGEEEKINPNASHISCTVEMFHEKEFYHVIVIDEAQMMTDKDRGFSWYKAITNANADEVHIIGSRNSKDMLLALLGSADIEIHEYFRNTPLEVEKKEFHIKHVKKGDALICFSRRRVLEMASRLQNDGHSVSMIYGSMPPETRKKQIEQFNKGITTVIVATDAIGMGLNLPIRRIVFLENEKFDGTRRRLLTSQEVKQIAGRAGRKGIYDVGKVAFASDIKKMRNLLQQEDRPVQTFAIAPTNAVFERFQRYYHDLGTFFELCEKFKSPKGTKKASLTDEQALYRKIAGTEIEARISLKDLYGFLHLPFSKNEQALTEQWEDTMYAIVQGKELPEPPVKEGNLEELELSYKAIGLHLLFLYRLGERTEAVYWERVREEISDKVQERLKTDIKKFIKKCKNCGKKLPWNHPFPTCDACYRTRFKKHWYDEEFEY